MASPEPSSPGNPDLFRALFQIFSDPRRLQWDLAGELARHVASEQDASANVDPVLRIRLEELCRIAEMHVASTTGLDTTVGGRALLLESVTPAEWATRTLTDWKPLLEVIAESHQGPSSFGEEQSADDHPAGMPPVLAQVFGQAAQAIGPAMLGMQLGSSIGYLARRAFAQYDYPIPRLRSERLIFVPGNIRAFSDDWSLPVDDVCIWICTREIAHNALISIEHVRSTLLDLLEDYARNFSPDPSALEERLASLDIADITDVGELQAAFGDPAEILASMVTQRQREIAEQLFAVIAAMEGWVDRVVDGVGRKLIASYGPLAEALRRRRVERDSGERYVDLLLGLSMDQETFDAGAAFVRGVEERAGFDALAGLWSRAEHLPTPAEIEAPGLWLERISFLD